MLQQQFAAAAAGWDPNVKEGVGGTGTLLMKQSSVSRKVLNLL